MVFTLLNQRSDSISSKKLTNEVDVYHLYFTELLVSVMKTSRKRSLCGIAKINIHTELMPGCYGSYQRT